MNETATVEKKILVKKLKGKILLVDDESYEKEFLEAALKRKNWDVNVEYFNNAEDALEHLRTNKDEIFLIISDMNMPKMDGLDFKKAIDCDPALTKKSIPFIFASSASTKSEITEAYNYRAQGYFRKPTSNDDQADMLDVIIKYWIISRHPNKDDI